MWTDEQLVKLLGLVRDVAWLPYPFPDDRRATTDAGARLLLALGQIAGFATKTLEEYDSARGRDA